MSDIIKFSEGGLPMFLDDFRLLQDNGINLRKTLIRLFCGDRNAIIDGAEFTYEKKEDGSVDVTVGEGAAFIGGDIVTWDEPLTCNYGNDAEGAFLSFEERDGDLRDFNDGNQKYCRVIRTAKLCTKKEEGVGYVDMLDENRFFPDVMKELLGFNGGGTTWQELEIASDDWRNGFSGSIKWTFINRYEITIELCISSDSTNWSNNSRSVFYWRSDSYGDRDLLCNDLKGRFSSAVFVGADGLPRNYIIEWANDERCMVLHGDGAAAPTPCGEIKGRFTIDLL